MTNKHAKQCPVCGALFVGRINSVFCSKDCRNKARAKKRNITPIKRYTAINGKNVCLSCGATKAIELFDLTPKGAHTAECHDCRREWRKKNKQRIRAMNGATPREQITALAEKKRQIRQAEAAANAAAKAEAIACFVGPRKPGKWIGENAYFIWRIENDPVFYARELDRAQRYKVRTRSGYKPSIIGWAQMPADVIAARHMLYRVSKQLKRRSEYEEH